jgi:hypothetical protein
MTERLELRGNVQRLRDARGPSAVHPLIEVITDVEAVIVCGYTHCIGSRGCEHPALVSGDGTKKVHGSMVAHGPALQDFRRAKLWEGNLLYLTEEQEADIAKRWWR